LHMTLVFLEHALALRSGWLKYINFLAVWGGYNLDKFCPVVFAVKS
jgi:hypothetical protein